jgi:hypothetical protein
MFLWGSLKLVIGLDYIVFIMYAVWLPFSEKAVSRMKLFFPRQGKESFPGRCAGFELRIGNCETCKKGGRSIMFCPNKGGALGLQEVDGSFAEYVIADSMFTVPIPDNVSFADAVTPHTIPLPPSP